MGLESLLTQCQLDSSDSYIAVIITKPPETILVILPNQHAATNTKANDKNTAMLKDEATDQLETC